MEKKDKLENVAIRMVKAPPLYSDKKIESPRDVVRVLGKELEDYDREVLCVVNFRSDGRPINMNIVSMGTVNNTIVEARDVFKTSILSNAAQFMLVHNHPSGNITPSLDDMKVTERIFVASEIMGIPLMDHVIIGQKGEYFSFLEHGALPDREKSGNMAAEKKDSILGAISQHKKEHTGPQSEHTAKTRVPKVKSMER